MDKNYFDTAISFENLYQGLKKSCRNIRWKDSVVGYENNGLLNTLHLREKLLSGEYEISKYQIFKIYEPKERTIVASRLVDRQVQRALCDGGLYEDFTEHFVRDNVACQVGKGTDDALNRLKVHLRRFYNKNGLDGWVLRCDIRHFFPEIRHDVAKAAVNKYVSDPKAAQMVNNIIDSFEGDKGLGLGSQISQLVALVVLNDMDHFIKEKLRIKYYIRYMDDFILIHPDREYLKECKIKLTEYLANLGLQLNKKTMIHPLKQGIIFLQWRFVINKTGKILMLINPDKVTKEKHRLKRLIEKEIAGEVPKGTTEASFQSWMSNAARGNTYVVQQKMNQFYKELCRSKEEQQNVNRKLSQCEENGVRGGE